MKRMKPYFSLVMALTLALNLIFPAMYGGQTAEAAVEPTVTISPISGYESANMVANGNSVEPAISADGRYVAFISDASNLTGVDADLEVRLEYDQVYLHDRQTGLTTLISVDITSGTSPSNGGNRSVSISADGQYIAFESDADNLIIDDVNGYSDIFVWDRVTTVIKSASVPNSGDGPDSASYEPSISADGSYVLFQSNDSVYRANLHTDEILQLVLPFFGSTSSFVLSGDGRFAVFVGDQSLYRYDFNDGASELLLQSDPLEVNSYSYESPVISHDGQYIAFRESKWIGGFDSALIRVMDTMLEGDNLTTIGPVEDNSYDLSMSPNGRYISFIASTSSYPAIAPSDAWEDAYDLYIWDRTLGAVAMASDDQIRANVSNPSVSDNGTIAFENTSNILVSYSVSSAVGWDNGAALTFTSVGDEPVLEWPNPQSGQVEGFHIFKEVTTLIPYFNTTTTYLGHANAADRSFFLTDANMHEGDRLKVYAVNGEYNRSASPLSGEYHITDTEAPYWASGNASLRASYIDTIAPRLDWNTATDNSGSIAAYTIWRIVDEVRTLFAETSNNYMNLADLQPATSYTFVIQAQDASGNLSSDSEPVTFQTLSAHAETGVLTGQFTEDEITLSWTPSQHAAGSDAYRILRVVSGNAPVQIASIGEGTTNYTDTVTPGITYYYQVKGYDQDNVVVYQSNLIEISTGTIAPPDLSYTSSTEGEQFAMNSTLSFTATAESGIDVAAAIVYETWFEEGGKKRAYPRPVETSVSLVEDPDEPGMYEGNWLLPEGTSTVVSLQSAVILDEGNQVRGDKLQMNKTVAASAMVTFNIGHLNEGYQTQLQEALTNADTIISLQVEEEEEPKELEFTSFDQSYTFNNLPSGGIATVAVGDYFAIQQARLLPGLLNRIVLSNVKINPTLTVSVVDANLQPLSNMEVKFFDSDGDERFRGQTNDNGVVTTSRLPIGSGTVSVGVQNTLFIPQPAQEVEITITPVQNNFVMQGISAHSLTGTVKDMFDVPIEGVKVSVSQYMNDGYQFSTGLTGADGQYTVNAYQGAAEVNLANYQKQLGFPERASLNLTGTQSTYDPIVSRYEEGYVFLKLYMKKLDGRVEGPFKLDRETLLRWNITLQDALGKQSTYSQYPIRTWGSPGDEIELCIEGFENQDAVCKKVATDVDNSALIEMTIEEESRFEAKFNDDDALYQDNDFQFRLERWRADTQQWAFFKQFRSNPLSESLPAGKYKYEATTSYGVSTSGEFETQLGDLNNLGDIPLVRVGKFAGKPGNGLVAMAGQVLPGETVTMRGAFRNGDLAVTGAKLLIEIPAGTELVPGSIQLQYSAGTSGNTVEDTQSPAVVQLGDMLSKNEGTVTYRLRVSETYMLPELTARLHLLWSGGEEMIGRASIPTTLISMQAPTTVYSDHVLLNGRAPGGRVVTLYDGIAVIGQTIAYPGGYWSKEVQLSDLGQPSRHMLRAEATVADHVMSTPTHTLMFVTEEVRMEEIVMKQFNGKEVVIQPENGVARFPFTINPYAPTSFAVYFSEPDRIEIAQVRFNSDEPVQLEKDEQGVFRADIIPGYTAGAVYVEYKIKKQTEVRLQGDADEIKAKLPPHLRNFDEGVEIIAENAETGSLGGARFDLGDYAVRTETYSLPDDGYQLTEEEELAVAENRAPEVFGVNLDWTLDDTELGLTVTYYQEAEPSLVSKGSRRDVQILGVTKVLKKIQQEIVMTVKNPAKMRKLQKKAEEINDAIEEGQGALEMIRDNFDATNDFADRMNRLVALAELAATCPPTNDIWNKHIVSAIDHIAVLSAYSMVISVGDFLNPFSFDEVGIDPVGSVVDFINETAIDGRIDGLESSVLSSIMHKCDDDTPGDRPGISLKRGSDGSGSGSGAGGSGWGGGKAASPVYIYDPSGYIYEAVPANRITDATVNLFEQQADDSWSLWDAEWFGLENPQISDTEGKYGWDVPFGTWQVAVNKDGYLPAESAELVVPPQHFDVNIPIVSVEPPTVEDIQAWTEAGTESSEIVVTFSRYIEADLISNESIVVTGSNGVIAGQVELVNVQQDSDDRDLTNKIRFAADESLQAGELLTIYVDSSSIASYAGIAMISDEEQDTVVGLKDTSGSVLDSAVVGANGKDIRLTFNEAIDPASLIHATNISLMGTDAAPAGLVIDASKPNGRTVKLLLSQSVKAGESVRITIPSEQFRDSMQNGSIAVTNLPVSNSLLSSNARLSALEIYQDGRKMTMPFESGKSRYTVNATIGTAITIIATAAESLSSIHIEDRAYNGVPLSVQAVENGAHIPITVTGPDGVTKAYYSIIVNRVPAVSVEEPEDDTGTGTSSNIGGLPVPPNSTVLDLAKGEAGRAALNDEIIVSIPKNALDQATRITIDRIDDIPDALNDKSMKLVSSLFEILKSVDGRFNHPVMITLKLATPLEPGQIAAIYYFDETAKKWVKIGGTIQGQSIHAEVDHFTKFAAFAYEPAVGMTDVNGHWAIDAIAGAIDRGLASGYPDHSFKPEKQITRAEFAVMLSRALQLENRSDIRAQALSFKDAVSFPSWASSHIALARSAGLINGYDDGTFRPNKPITRAEIVVMAVRALKLANDTSKATFFFVDDKEIPSWAKSAVSQSVVAGIIKGKNGNRFAPADQSTRAEAVTILIAIANSLTSVN